MIWNYSNLYKPKKIGAKKLKFKTIKNKKVYKKFLKAIILLCIILSFITLMYSVGNIIGIVQYTNHDALIISNIFLDIANNIFNNLTSIFFLLTISICCNNKKSCLLGILALLVFFSVQHSFIINIDKENIKILYFFQISNLVLFNNLGINSLNLGVMGGAVFGLICSWIITKLDNIRLPKIVSFFNGFPIITISLLLITFLIAILFLLIYILFYFFIVNLHFLILNNIYLNNIFFIFFKIFFFPFGLCTFINDVFNFNKCYDITNFIKYFKIICFHYEFTYNDLLNKWNNNFIQNFWDHLQSLNFKEQLSINQWILLLPFNSLPNNHNQMIKIFDWFCQTSFGENYSILFGFFSAFAGVLIFTAKKENMKETLFAVSFMFLMVLLTGKTYALSLMLLFVSPLLYFGLFLPVSILNGILINLLHIHLVSIFGTGLIDYITFGIIPNAKGTNFGWIFLFSGIWFIFSAPVLYFIIIKKDLPFIGRTETIIPRFTHRQIHEIFNH